MREPKYKIIYEDEAIIVVYKKAGLALASSHVGQMDLVSLLTQYLSRPDCRQPYLGIVHRLDQPVEGLVVFAKTKEAAAHLSKQAAGTDMEKIYEARIYGHLPSDEDIFIDYLSKDSKTNMAVKANEGDEGAKYSKLSYEVVDRDEKTDYVRIKLYTGRHHQIRAQFAFRDYPLVGDVKYGREDANLFARKEGIRFVCLKAAQLSFIHPVTNKRVTYTA